MAAKPPDSAAARPSESGTGGAAGGRLNPDERVGPLVIARHVKADGRALILYSRTEPESR
jgi:hypothetical protein